MSSYGAYPSPSPAYGGGYAPVMAHDPTAVMGRRIGAYLIDGILIFLVTAGLVVAGFFAFKPYTKYTGLTTYKGSALYSDQSTPTSVFGASGFCDSYNHPTDGSSHNGVCVPSGDDNAYVIEGGNVGTLYGLLIGADAICWLLDWVILQGITGASVGKLLLGLRVVKHDGQICGVGRALLRTVLLIVDSFCFALVGLITSVSSKGHRRVGDMAASTLVVRKEQVGTPVSVPGLTAPGVGGPYGTAPAFGTAYPPPSYVPPTVPSGVPPTGSGSSSPEAAGWAQPSTTPSASTTPAGAESAPSGDGPHWDEARQAYITYDRSRGAWLEYDQAKGSWGPISQ